MSVSILTPDTVSHYISDVGGSKVTALAICSKASEMKMRF